MNLADELAPEIWYNEAFQYDLATIASVNIQWELQQTGLFKNYTSPENEVLCRLLQAAMIFADCDDERFHEGAQRISTASLRLAGYGDEGIKDLFTLVQARLRNFPALASADAKPIAPASAPLTLQYEFITSRSDQTIGTENGIKHILTKFQLDSWRILSAGRSATISSPTSAGKSYILLLRVIERFRQKGPVAVVYLVPTRALINQVAYDAHVALTGSMTSEVTVSTAPVDLMSGISSKTLYVLTQERLEALLIASPAITFNMMIIDEAQMLSDGTRGVLLEAVLDRVRRHDSSLQLIFSGPMINNPTYYGDVFNIHEFTSCVTARSSVTQNIIYLDYVDQPRSAVAVKLGSGKLYTDVANIPLPLQLRTEIDRISYLSYLFGRSGTSIVYANGKAEAEKIAIKISNEMPTISPITSSLLELIEFVKQHVHREYALVITLEKGIGFHYGHMPSLLRKTLEDCFKDKQLSFLVCTSTLLYGLNLPARNIFMLKPNTGRGSPISGADFWNLAGRAGRLGKELEGNVYLVDYQNWVTNPVQQQRGVTVTSALKQILVDRAEELVEFLDDAEISSEASPENEIVLGKLILDDRLGQLDRTIDRYLDVGSVIQLDYIRKRIKSISEQIDLPTDVLNKNIGVSVFRQIDLLNYMITRLAKLTPNELIPAHPLVEFSQAHNNYRRVFKRIHTYLLKYPSKDKRHNFFSGLALRWMRGDPLPVLIESAIKHNRSQGSVKSTASIIRDTMANIEDDLRFRYVRFFTCYNSILIVALKHTHNEAYIDSIPDIPLFLEMGGSSGAMINLMALGLSRTSAETVAEYVTDKDMSVEQLRQWLRSLNVGSLDISPICVREIEDVLRRN